MRGGRLCLTIEHYHRGIKQPGVERAQVRALPAPSVTIGLALRAFCAWNGIAITLNWKV
ncbi:MAG: hypothetical protein U1F42_01175 [Candidatus Competibacteraceae bacterium]